MSKRGCAGLEKSSYPKKGRKEKESEEEEEGEEEKEEEKLMPPCIRQHFFLIPRLFLQCLRLFVTS